MIGSWLDSFIGVFSPRTGFRRAQFRKALDKVRGYDGAAKDRRRYNWSAKNNSADRELSGSADVIRARVRDLVRNNPYAAAAIEAIVANVVGCGIVPQIREMMTNEQPNEELNETRERAFRHWAENEADSAGRLTFWEMQSLALKETAEAGEIYLHRVLINDDKRSIPLAYELIDADRFDTSRDTGFTKPTTGNEVRRGVELDQMGRPVAYYIYPTHPTELTKGATQSVRIPASRIIPLFKTQRAGQTRGISWLAPCMSWLRDLQIYFENELQASAVASCFSVAIKSDNPDSSLASLQTESDTSSDSAGNAFTELQPGMVSHLAPHEDVAIINPSRGQSDSKPWIDLIIRSIALSVGLSYEVLSRDYSQTDFSSNRASDLESRRRFRPMQKFLTSHMCMPVWRDFVAQATLKGLPGFSQEVAQMVEWQSPGWEWVDPMKEAQAADLAVKSNLSTLRDQIAARGGDWREVIRQRKTEQQALKDADLLMEPEDGNQGKETSKESQEAQAAA